MAGQLLGDRIALPVTVTSRAVELVAPSGVTRSSATKTVDPGARWRRPASRASGSPATSDGGFILPGFLPAFDAAAALVKMLDLLALHGTTLSEVVAALPAVHVGPRDRRDAVGAEGRGDALARRADARTATSSWSTG